MKQVKVNSQEKRERQVQFVRQLVSDTMQNLRTLKRMYDKQHELDFGSMEVLDYFYSGFNTFFPKNPNAGNYTRNDWVFNSRKLRGLQPENFMKQTKEDQLIAEQYSRVVNETHRPIIVNGKEVEDINVENDNEIVAVVSATFTNGTELTDDEIMELEKNYPDEVYNIGFENMVGRADMYRDMQRGN